MNLTTRQIQKVISIDNHVAKIVKKGKTSQEVDEAIILMLLDHKDGFKHLLDTLDSAAMDNMCAKFSGFYRFAKMMERVAEGCRDGLLDDIIK